MLKTILKTTYILLLVAVSCAFAQKAAKDIYQDKCAGCHGADGEAKTARGKKLNMKSVKEMNAKLTADQMTKIITDGKGADMPSYKGELKADEIKGVTEYYRSLAK
jgi:mono/diheme cytochrome c family protein